MVDNQATPRTWIGPPEMSDDAITAGTGKRWDEWCDLIDASPHPLDGHQAIANYVRTTHGVGDWWVQAVTVGYERINGLRLPHQMADGTFTANKSKTLTIDAKAMRTLLLSNDGRTVLFPGLQTELRSKPTAKTLRVSIGPGVASIGLDRLSDGRSKLTVQHASLPSLDDVETWKAYWADWLNGIGDKVDEVDSSAS